MSLFDVLVGHTIQIYFHKNEALLRLCWWYFQGLQHKNKDIQFLTMLYVESSSSSFL